MKTQGNMSTSNRPPSMEDEEMSRPSYLLDIGAGSGLSGEILTEEGHEWVGLDVSGGMLGKSLLPCEVSHKEASVAAARIPTEINSERFLTVYRGRP